MAFFRSDGHQLFYREAGSGPLLFVLPGQTASSACHLGELDYFSSRFHVVSLDFHGTGQSDRLEQWPPDWWARNARDCAALADHLDHSTFSVMGTSGGAIVALWVAILFPEKTRAVIADSTVESYPAGTLEKVVAGRDPRDPNKAGFWQYANGADWEQVIAADSDLLLRISRRGGSLFDNRLNEIRCPVLLTASLKDQDLPDPAAQNCRMAAQIPGSQVVLANQGGHPLMWTAAEVFRRHAVSFLEIDHDTQTVS